MQSEILAAIITAATSIIGTLAFNLVSYLKNKALKKKVQTLEDYLSTDDTEYYIICPNCNSKIVLNKIKILTNKQDNI